MEMLIKGPRPEEASGRIEVRDPDDGSLIDTVPRGTRADALRALDVAEEGARIARAMPTHERMRVLRDAAARVESDADAFARLIAREGIKTIREARAEVARAVDTLRISAEEARRLHGETVPFDQTPGHDDTFAYYVPEPVGIVVAITPFNDPLNLVAHKLGPAVAAGNAVVLKPDSKTPLSALRLAGALLDAGLPAEALQVVTGPGSEVGTALVRDPRVRLVSFTGGRQAGEAIHAAGGIKRYGMELGSNAPTLVMADADLQDALPRLVSGAFWAAGQNCLHVQRLLIDAPVYEAVRDPFVEAASKLRLGPKLDESTDMGPLIDEANAERVLALVRSAVEAGARLLCGGHGQGTRVQPTVLEDVPADHPLALEEVYGPVTVLMRFDGLDQGLAIANAVDTGLQAALFTRDLAVARRAAKDLRYGGVMINDSTDVRIDAMPFGGLKASGLGREGVRFALHEMTELKFVSLRDPLPTEGRRQ